uniref:Uncharacterized protein n=1 Tax=Helianthus annuus TaxID=4232 RepID=A0A251TKH9_HELAN
MIGVQNIIIVYKYSGSISTKAQMCNISSISSKHNPCSTTTCSSLCKLHKYLTTCKACNRGSTNYMFVCFVMYRISFHRGLPGRYAKMLGDVHPKYSRLGLSVSRPTRQVCED